MSLYSLNKDLLVKLVSQIREDTLKECQEEMDMLKLHLSLYQEGCGQQDYPLNIIKCSHPDCKSLYTTDNRDVDIYTHCDDFLFCRAFIPEKGDECLEMYCNLHNFCYICGSKNEKLKRINED